MRSGARAVPASGEFGRRRLCAHTPMVAYAPRGPGRVMKATPSQGRGEDRAAYSGARTESLSPGLHTSPLRAAFAPTGAFGSVPQLRVSSSARRPQGRGPGRAEAVSSQNVRIGFGAPEGLQGRQRGPRSRRISVSPRACAGAGGLRRGRVPRRVPRAHPHPCRSSRGSAGSGASEARAESEGSAAWAAHPESEARAVWAAHPESEGSAAWAAHPESEESAGLRAHCGS